MYVTATGSPSRERSVISVFSGLDARLRAGEGTFSEMENGSARAYPALRVRRGRRNMGFGSVRDAAGALVCGSDGAAAAREIFSVAGVGVKSSRETASTRCFAVISVTERADTGGVRFTLELEFIKEDGSAASIVGHTFYDSVAAADKADETREKLRSEAALKRIIARAGYVYVMPDGIRVSLVSVMNEIDETFDNVTETGMTEASSLGSNITFTFAPSTAEGEEDVKIINSGTVTKKNGSRGANALVKIESGHSVSVNMYGLTVMVREDGKTVEWVHNGVAETIAPESGFYALTGHGTGFNSLWGIEVGNYIEFDSAGLHFTAYESEALSSIATEKPDDPKNGKRWRDKVTGKLYQWSAAYSTWADISQDYIKVSVSCDVKSEDAAKFFCLRNGKQTVDLQGKTVYTPLLGFDEGDAVVFDGISDELDKSYVISHVGNGYLILSGVLDQKLTMAVYEGHTVTIKRKMPVTDFAIECNNRLWGCRYGTYDDGNTDIVNEIYACGIGDVRNWKRFEGTAADSFAQGVGADGIWTGIGVYDDKPIFFKEDCFIVMSGSYPETFSPVEYHYKGVKEGSDKSVVTSNGRMYYHSSDGIMMFSGGAPSKIDAVLGDTVYSGGVAGAVRGRYYISLCNEEGERSLFVYDEDSATWHREDSADIRDFATVGGRLYAVIGTELWLMDDPDSEEKVPFSFTTGVMGYDTPDAKYVPRIAVTCVLPVGSALRAYVQYDMCGVWIPCAQVEGRREAVSFEIKPRRCRLYRIRFAGAGDFTLITITKTLEAGSEM